MNIQQLASTLQSQFTPTPGTLSLPAAQVQTQLQSTDLATLVTDYFAGTLTITDTSAPNVTTDSVIYSGTVSFLGAALPASAIFYLVNQGTPELTLALTLPQGWTFSQTYPPLKDQIIDQLSFDQPLWVLESFDNNDDSDGSNTYERIRQGLNFSGTLEASSSDLLTPVNWLLSTELLLTGTLTNWDDPTQTAPTMTLQTAPEATSLTLGTVALNTYIAVASGYSTSTNNDPAAASDSTLTTSVSLNAQLNVGGSGVLTLSMELQNDPDILTFSLNGNQMLNALADLAGFAGGSSLNNMIPPQYPLSQYLRLDNFTITVAPSTQEIVNLSFGIALLETNNQSKLLDAASLSLAPRHAFSPLLGPPRPLVVVPNSDVEAGDVEAGDEEASAALARLTADAADKVSPTWVIVPNAISISDIYVRFLIVDPLHISSKNIFVNIGATFWIAELYPIECDIKLPDVQVDAYLLPGYTIPLTDLMQHFNITPPSGFELDVTKFSMSANPNYKTFALTTELDGSVTLISLNNGALTLTLTGIGVDLTLDQTGYTAKFIAYSNFANTVDFFIMAAKPAADSSAWVFEAAITHPFSVGELIYNITGWQPPAFVNDMKVMTFDLKYDTGSGNVTFDVSFQWLFTDLDLEIGLKFHLEAVNQASSQSSSGQDTGQRDQLLIVSSSIPNERALVATSQKLYTGSIEGDFDFMGLKLTFIYAFDQVNKTNTYTIKFQEITVTFANPDKAGDKVMQFNFGNTTFGDILVFLIKLAEPGASPKLSAPWDALNGISLKNLSLTLNFTQNFIEVDYNGTFDLGFLKLENVGLKYTRSYGQGKVEVKLAGEFLGQSFGKENPLTWDAVNGQPPAVPGAGAKLLDLQYLGVGQHVSINTDDLDTVTKVITALEKTVVPLTSNTKNPLEQVGGLQFDSGTNWMLGANFKLLDTFTVNLVMFDPKLYGLLIQISGPEASIFEGLSFEIIYRKISDNLGVFHIELKLPDAIRHLEFGAVSVTLPIIIIDIYTNGNFRIDFGFPKSLQDFSNSLAIEVFPFVGYGGFYFALLSGATSTNVPVIDNGNFNPVIEFGFALSVGVGKTFSLGPLSAGVSVTVTGMVQGVLAWFHPNEASTPKAMYYWLQGTIAIVGKVYGTVDFVVVKASLSLTVYASVTLTIEAYQPIIIHMEAGVEVKLSVKILFITLHFSFSAKISFTFTIGSAKPTPWHLKPADARALQMRNQRSLHSAAPRFAALLAPHEVSGVRLARPASFSSVARAVAAQAAEQTKLTLYLTPLFSQALPSDFLTPPSGSGAVVTGNVLLMINNAIPTTAQTAREVAQPAADATAQPFNILLTDLLQWALQFIGKDTGDIVTAVELEAIHDQLDDPDFVAQTFSYPNLTNFFTQFNLVFELALRPTEQTDASSASVFPIFPELTLTVDGNETSFWTQNPVDSNYVKDLSAYFQQLQVEYENSVERDPQQTGAAARQAKTLAVDDDSPTSMAGYLFSSYFALLTKAVVQNALDHLKTYQFTVTDAANTSLASIAGSFPTAPGEYIVRQGDSLDALAAQFRMPLTTLRAANDAAAMATLTPGARLAVPVAVVPGDIVTANQTQPGLFSVNAVNGAPLALNQLVYQIKADDTFKGIAQTFSYPGYELDPLAVFTDNAAALNLLQKGATFNLPTLNYTGRNGDTLANVAAYFNVPEAQVTQNNLQFTIQGAQYTCSGGFVALYAWKDGDTLDSVIQYFFGPLTADQLPTFEALLEQWNLTTDFTAIQPGAQIQIPLSETLTNLGRYYFPNASAADQLSQLAAVLEAAALLAPLATLTINGVNYPPQADDTFSSIAQQFNLTLAELGDQIAAQPGLFPDGAELAVPNAPALAVSQLLSDIQAAASTNSAAASTSRFLLQGLRLPYPQITDSTYPLYSLSAQSFPLASATPTISLGFNHSVNWVQFADGGTTLSIPLTTDEEAQIQAFETDKLETGINWLGRLPLFKYQPLHYSLQNPLPWQAAALPAGTCFSNAGQAVTEPTLWPLPAALAARLATDNGAASGAAAFYELDVSTYINATVGLQTSEVGCYTWATTVPCVVQQIQAASGAGQEMTNTYLVNGADDTGKQTLFDLLNYLTASGQTDSAQICLLYAPNPASANAKGYVSDQLNAAQTFVLKTNLSTLSHSGAQRALLAKAAEEAGEAGEVTADSSAYSATLGDATDFLQLVWQASVVKSGGFYLQYTTASGDGLPGYLFTQSPETSVTLLILLKSQTQATTAPLQAFNNTVVIGSNLDAGQADIFVAPRTYQVQPNDTLQSIAQTLAPYGLTVTTLAQANQTVMNLLKAGLKLPLGGSAVYQVQPGDSLASIAAAHNAQYQTTVTSLTNLIAALPAFTPGALLQFAGEQSYIIQPKDTLGGIVQTLNVSGLDVAALATANQDNSAWLQAGQTLNLNATQTYVIQTGDTLASIAHAHAPATVAGIAQASQTLAILSPYALAFYGAQQLEMQASVPPGSTGFQLWRTYTDSDANQQQLNQLFNLLGFQIAANTYFSVSYEGLPAGPVREPGLPADDTSDDGVFYYQQVLSYTQSALPAYNPTPVSAALPAASASPYAGIYADAQQSSALQLNLTFHDLSGNRTVADVPPVLSPLPIGYTDDLIGLSQWPSLALSYAFPNAQPQLQLNVQFNPAKYLPAPGQAFETSQQSARADLEHYAAIYYQLQEPGLQQCAVSTSFGLIGATATLTQELQLGLLGLVSQAYRFLTAASALEPVYPPVAAGTALSAFATEYVATVADVMTANKDVELLEQVFAASTPLNIPHYYTVKAGDTLSAILTQVTTAQLEANAALGLQPGTELIIPTQTATVPTAPALALVQIAQAWHTTVLDLATNNAAQPALNDTLNFTLNGLTQAVTATDTLTTIAAAFNAQDSSLNATPEAVAVANQTISGVYPGQPLSFTTYVIQQGDTLASVAAAFNLKVADLITLNLNTANVFPSGAALYLSGADTPYTLQAGDTFALVASHFNINLSELAASNGDAVLLALNQTADNQTLAVPNVVEWPSDSAATYYASYVLRGGAETLNEVLAKFSGWDVAGFVALNQGLPGLLTATPLPNSQVTPQLTDTLQSLAQQLSVTPLALAQTLLTLSDRWRPGALVLTPPLNTGAQTVALASLAQSFNADAQALAQANSALNGLLAQQSFTLTYTLPDGTSATHSYQSGAHDTLLTVVAQLNQLFDVTTIALADVLAQNPNLTLTANQMLVPPVLAAQLPPLPVTLPDSYPEPIFPLEVEFQLLRDQRRVDPDFRNDADVFSNSASLAPQLSGSANDPLSLKAFATAFETAFDQQLKLGTGAASSADGGATSNGQPRLWVVNCATARNGIGFAPEAGQPAFFALRPLSNQLWSQDNVPVNIYSSANGLQSGPNQNFQNADVDAWLATLLSALDQLLSPQFAIPAYQLGATAQAQLDQLLDCKQSLAQGLQGLVTNLLQGGGGNLSSAQEALYQQALIALASVYETTLLVQFPFDVQSPFTDSQTAPQLSGKPVIQPYVNAGQITDSTLVKHALSSGDSFLSIANEFGIAVLDLVTGNQTVADVFAPQSTVTLKVSGTSTTSVTANSGDTLAAIAGKFFGTTTPDAAQVEAFAVALWNCDLTSGQAGSTGSYTLNSNAQPPINLQFVEVLPVISFTTSKLPLQQGTNTFTSLVSVKNAAQRRMAFLDLTYAINELEYDIQLPPASLARDLATNYRESSWLTFINPLNSADLGQVQMPIPLREHPGFPVLTAQTATATYPNSTELAKAKQWDYAFHLNSQNAAQDSMELGLFFNRVSTTPPTPPNQLNNNSGENPALNAALANFNAVYPEISADLALLLTEPSNAAVGVALQAFTTLVQAVSTAWQNAPQRFALALDEDGEQHWYDFATLINQQQPEQYEYLLLANNEPQPLWPTINNANPTLALTSEALYDFTAPVAQPLDLTFSFDALDTIQRQSGWAGLSITRNQNLLGSAAPTEQTNPAFVYQTPLTLFTNQITPSLLLDVLAPLSENNSVADSAAALKQALSDFFTVLFNLATQPPATTFQIRAACRYVYVLAAQETDIIAALNDPQTLAPSLPLVLNPTANFNPTSDADPTNPNSFVSLLAEAVLANANALGLTDSTGAALVPGACLFDVTVYSSLLQSGQTNVASKPVLDIRKRYWLPPSA